MVAEESRGVFPFSSSGLKHVPSSSWNVVLSSFFLLLFSPSVDRNYHESLRDPFLAKQNCGGSRR